MYDQAEAALDRIEAEAPGHTFCRYQRALVLMARGRELERAVELLDWFVRRRPEPRLKAWGLYQKGRVLERMHRRGEAAASYEEALSLYPAHHPARRALKRLQRRMRR